MCIVVPAVVERVDGCARCTDKRSDMGHLYIGHERPKPSAAGEGDQCVIFRCMGPIDKMQRLFVEAPDVLGVVGRAIHAKRDFRQSTVTTLRGEEREVSNVSNWPRTLSAIVRSFALPVAQSAGISTFYVTPRVRRDGAVVKVEQNRPIGSSARGSKKTVRVSELMKICFVFKVRLCRICVNRQRD